MSSKHLWLYFLKPISIRKYQFKAHVVSTGSVDGGLQIHACGRTHIDTSVLILTQLIYIHVPNIHNELGWVNLKPLGEQQQQNVAFSFTGVPQEEEESKQLGFFLLRGERKKEMGAAGGFVIFLAKKIFLNFFFSWRAESLWVCWFVKCVSWMWRVLLAPVKDVSCITVAVDTEVPTPLDLTPLWFGSLGPKTVWISVLCQSARPDLSQNVSSEATVVQIPSLGHPAPAPPPLLPPPWSPAPRPPPLPRPPAPPPLRGYAPLLRSRWSCLSQGRQGARVCLRRWHHLLCRGCCQWQSGTPKVTPGSLWQWTQLVEGEQAHQSKKITTAVQ